ALDRVERIRAAAVFLQSVQDLRGSTGAPHWVVIDEAHHLFPTDGGRAEEMRHFDWRGVCLVTHEPERLAPELLRTVGHPPSTSLGPVTRTLPLVGRDAIPGGELAAGEALDIALADGRPPAVRRFRVALRETEHKRHVEKYATGKLPAERAFRFRGPAGAVDLVANNLETFVMLVRGVDDVTWLHHLRNGDVSRWLA